MRILYAIVDTRTSGVYEIGRFSTADEAIMAAIAGITEDAEQDLMAVPITEAAYAYVKDHRAVPFGAPCRELIVTRHGVCLRSEMKD